MSTQDLFTPPANLQAPAKNVHPAIDFVRFKKEWTARSIPDLFKACVDAGAAERVALGLPHLDLSYRDLDQLSDCVAHALSSLCNSGSEPIPLLLEHDTLVPAAMLGVLKAGKFSVPLDPSYPLERNRYVLSDSQARLLITNSRNMSLASSLRGRDCRALNLDELSSRFSGDYPKVQSSANDLVQVLYTSGSTGKPKGVMHSHHSLLSNVMRHTNGRHTGKEDRVAVLFSYSFGAAIVNLFSALLNGGAAFPFNVRDLGVVRLAQWLVDREITQVHTVPTLFRHFVDALGETQTFPNLRLIELGGETMFWKDVERFKKHFSDDCVLSIGMGSAETGHVFDCGYNKETECGTGIVPAGYSLEGTKALLLDGQHQPVGPGCVGEIAIKSSFLSPGYWRQPELTAKVFLQDPEGGPDRIYLTGDLGYMLPDGCMFHLGRKDARVKIKGYRIEIPEVESALLHIPGVKEAAVTVHGSSDDDKRLVAYIASKSGAVLTARTLRKALREILPNYMVPSTFVLLESLPLLPNGKVDRVALPARMEDSASSEKSQSGPRYLIEAQLCAIWEEMLELPRVGVGDDFYDLGGDSLLAVKMISRIDQVCGRKLSLSEFGSEITIERLAQACIGQQRLEHDHQALMAPVRLIQSGGSKRPFFFHNGDCETGGLYCRNLARQLGPDQPFYSLMPHGFYRDPVPETIEAMAADRLRSVLAIQPTGPYLLGGFCYGGVVAFEMARQLSARGFEVEAVLMIDSRARHIGFKFIRDVVAYVACVLRLNPGTETELFRRLKLFLLNFQEALGRSAWQAVRFVGSKMKSYVMRAARSLGRAVRNSDSSSVSAPAAWETSTPYWYSHLAMDAYVPGKYDGHVVLFRSTSLLEKVPHNLTAGWSHITPKVTVEWLSGDHRTCVAKHVAELAKKMRPYLAGKDGPSASLEMAVPDEIGTVPFEQPKGGVIHG